MTIEIIDRRATDWLDDPLNPHAIAATRGNSYTKFTLQSIIQCLMDFADAEFSRDSAESVARARTLYLSAVRLLDSASLGRGTVACQADIDALDAEVSTEIISNDRHWQPAWKEAKLVLGRIADQPVFRDTIDAVRATMATNDGFTQRITTVLQTVSAAAVAIPKQARVSNLIAGREQRTAGIHAAALTNPDILSGSSRVGACVGEAVVTAVETVVGVPAANLTSLALPFLREPATFTATTGVSRFDLPLTTATPGRVLEVPPNPLAPPPEKCLAETYRAAPLAAMQLTGPDALGFTPGPSLDFCVPQNPIPPAWRLHAQLNLFKIRNCRNIAGDQRALEPYAAPVEVSTGLPGIGIGGEIVIPRRLQLPSTPYRYTALVDRAKQLVGLAQQVEAAFLSALEKHDAEFYNLIRARQEVRLARAGVRLQDLRVKEAGDGVTLAELQRERAEIQGDHFQDLLTEGLLAHEIASLSFMAATAATHALAGVVSGFSAKSFFGSGSSALSSFASALSTTASIFQTLASNERR